MDGKDLYRVLTGTITSEHECVFIWQQGNTESGLYDVRCENYKVHYITAGVQVEGHPGKNNYPEAVKYHNPPLIFDVMKDPSEQHSLSANSSGYKIAGIAHREYGKDCTLGQRGSGHTTKCDGQGFSIRRYLL